MMTISVNELKQFLPDDAPEWAFFWDSNKTWGYVTCLHDWLILLYDVGVADPTSRHHPLQAKRCSNTQPGHRFGFRLEHTGDETLRQHAEKYNLSWMLRMLPRQSVDLEATMAALEAYAQGGDSEPPTRDMVRQLLRELKHLHVVRTGTQELLTAMDTHNFTAYPATVTRLCNLLVKETRSEK